MSAVSRSTALWRAPRRKSSASDHAFTMVEMMVVVVIIGVLAAVVIPLFGGAGDDAKSGALESSLGGVRASLAGYRAQAVLAGDPPFPTLEQLRTPGVVMQRPLPPNPYSEISAVQAVSLAQAEARAVINPLGAGWNYFVDNSANPPVAIFYANSTAETRVLDDGGIPLGANEL